MSKGVWGLIAVVLIAVAVAIAGCGGGGSDETLTKAEFTKQANAICKKAADRRAKIIGHFLQTVDPKEDEKTQQEEVVFAALPTYKSAAQQIDELGAPEGEDEKVQELVKDMEEAVKRAEANPQSAVVAEAAFKKPNELAKSYGLEDCVA